MSSRIKHVNLAACCMLGGSVLGLLASFILSVESLVLAGDSQAVLSCDMNVVFSCSSVAKHWSSTVFGFPNSFIGLVTLPVMTTIAVALMAGVEFPRWFMRAAQIGTVVGLVFAGWMFYMSFFEIQALCPWCLTLDVGMLLLFVGLTRYNVLYQSFGPKELKRLIERDFDLLVAAVTIVATGLMISMKYGFAF